MSEDGQQVAVLVVDRLLVERLRDPLRDAAVDLAVDDHRIDDLADVVDGDVAQQLNVAGLGVDLHDGGVRAARPAEVRRVVDGASPRAPARIPCGMLCAVHAANASSFIVADFGPGGERAVLVVEVVLGAPRAGAPRASRALATIFCAAWWSATPPTVRLRLP